MGYRVLTLHYVCGCWDIDCEEGPDPEKLLKQITEAQEELIKSTNWKFGDPSLDLDNLVPRKANWDIERSLEPKLNRLEKRTQRAILQIVQGRVAEEQNQRALEQPDLSSDDE